MFKLAFWGGLIALAVLAASKLIPVYYDNLKIQNIFEGVTQNIPNRSPSEVKNRVNELLKIQSVDIQALPKDFFENLSIVKQDGKLSIASSYHVVVWFFGEPQSVDPDEDYAEKDVAPMDKLRLRARMDIDFSPHAITP